MVNFAPPPDDAVEYENNSRQFAGVNRKETTRILQAAPGDWAQVYGPGTDAPEGGTNTVVNFWKKAGFEVRVKKIERTEPVMVNDKKGSVKYSIWLRWPLDKPVPMEPTPTAVEVPLGTGTTDPQQQPGEAPTAMPVNTPDKFDQVPQPVHQGTQPVTARDDLVRQQAENDLFAPQPQQYAAPVEPQVPAQPQVEPAPAPVPPAQPQYAPPPPVAPTPPAAAPTQTGFQQHYGNQPPV